ncbi:MAG: mannose-1-phosphate guanylyltransferase/mannose-6-phosphate isomerase [Hallerella sp.]|jgi:mannose-1-phosphate guanylyltransferase|nr:mannose-1-phosphate guanylyltransferase/mannose-6-phosphate isomerase [Fibrobacter sp.]MDY6369710.1 mannose-1-phosphate guanylyltransferase/mannose-6-phosphate isomerase [Fibrobacter sp.]MDY6389404.1 mannose-1-phosphate guanylyltransferase/mannose-6-phosphate isomerase [Fibrobacter sp.]MEE3340343.1 mannose-1-phosphate guanylyltransferase/mannose-6-phosphate isomerase [Hallerella sp.]
MINLILCGGCGTRLWPVSRTLMPKQFAKLFDGSSLFQGTVLTNSVACESQYVISNAEQYFLAKDQLSELAECGNDPHFMLEPVGRNTAPAIALACLSLDPNTVVLVSPSDHVIRKKDAYLKVLEKAEKLAEAGALVTFGITPTSPETGYGYIEADGENVKRFVEKPNLEKAKEYLQSGNFYWNSGIFCFKVSTFLSELEKYAPDMFIACKKALANAKKENELLRVNYDDMMEIPANSIDYAVMEKSKKVKVVPSDIGWSDLGSFDALYGEYPHDEAGNNVNPKHIPVGTTNSLVIGQQRMVATIDLDKMLVVDTPDALLVAPLASSQKVKAVVEKLKLKKSALTDVPQTVSRPWGSYSVLDDNERYKIKRIVVKPGKRLSLQKHLHRSEHWVVVSGTATCTVGEKIFYVRPNESTYIPVGEVHRLQNDGKLPLVIVEVQVGEYTGEDDIIRIQDDFKRS